MSNARDLSLWGPVQQYSPGTAAVMADRQIKKAMEQGAVCLDDSRGDANIVVTCKATGKWFLLSGGWGNDHVRTAMLGAACGDVAGSVYEWNNVKFKPNPDFLIHPAPHSRMTR